MLPSSRGDWNGVDIGSVRPISIEREMRQAYLDYAMSVITARALPDVRDGLKPVQRRVLYAMDELGLRANSSYKKSARIVGEVLGKYHPHGDAPVYETMVRMAQGFSMRYVLVDGQGNFGSVDGDPPAAMRYTEARLSTIAEEMLADIDRNTVDFEPNFDGSLRQPSVLPARIPNLLVNGAVGIAVGMATNIPPHNLEEVIDALVMMANRYAGAVELGGLPFDAVWARVLNRTVADGRALEIVGGLTGSPAARVQARLAARALPSPTADQRVEALVTEIDEMVDVTPDQIMAHVRGPDFPTAGLILGDEGIKQAYATGHGRITIRAKAHTEEIRGNRVAIVVSELPYQINKATLIERIADLVREKRIEGISDMRDESDRQGMRIVIELKRDVNATAMTNQLFKLTAMQSSYSINMLALVDRQPRVLTLKQILLQYLDWRRQVVTRRTEFDLERARARAHILQGLKVALDNLDEVIQTIRNSSETDAARQALMTRFALSEIQATAILDMQLRRLAALERQKILDELKEVEATVARLEDLLANPIKLVLIVRDELLALKEKFGDARRTRILPDASGDLTPADLVPDHDVVVLTSVRDYVRRLAGDAFRVRSSRRALPQQITHDDDAIRHLIVANTRDMILFFTNRGRVYGVACHELPEAQAKGRGLPIGSVTGVTGRDESLTAVVSIKNFDQGGHLILITRGGEAKRIRLSEYRNTRASGLIAMDLEEGDELVWAGYTPGNRHVMIVTAQGQSIRFSEENLRSASRQSGGVRAIRVAESDHVVDANIVEEDTEILLVTRRGFGKRLAVGQFSVQGRGGGGIRAMPVSDRSGAVLVARIVRPDDEVMIASRHGIVVRTHVATVPPLGRTAMGALIIKLEQKDSVTAMARLRAPEPHDGSDNNDDDGPGGDGAPRPPPAPPDGPRAGPLDPDDGEVDPGEPPAASARTTPGDASPTERPRRGRGAAARATTASPTAPAHHPRGRRARAGSPELSAAPAPPRKAPGIAPAPARQGSVIRKAAAGSPGVSDAGRASRSSAAAVALARGARVTPRPDASSTQRRAVASPEVPVVGARATEIACARGVGRSDERPPRPLRKPVGPADAPDLRPDGSGTAVGGARATGQRARIPTPETAAGGSAAVRKPGTRGARSTSRRPAPAATQPILAGWRRLIRASESPSPASRDRS
ncbi:MAG: hypothetical protein FJ033_14185 [Chloroflexi bacterium]|nr:hypothetical protein [Chloroflexota bacterium]